MKTKAELKQAPKFGRVLKLYPQHLFLCTNFRAFVFS